jgi:hypothetical protein
VTYNTYGTLVKMDKNNDSLTLVYTRAINNSACYFAISSQIVPELHSSPLRQLLRHPTISQFEQICITVTQIGPGAWWVPHDAIPATIQNKHLRMKNRPTTSTQSPMPPTDSKSSKIIALFRRPYRTCATKWSTRRTLVPSEWFLQRIYFPVASHVC